MLDQTITQNQTALQHQDYQNVLQRLAELQPNIDAFFEQVMVNVEDAALKVNRLQLLAKLNQTLSAVADLSLLQA